MTCSNCGLPDGDHYNLCFNSPYYYSPEQERYDDAMDDGSDDNRERYAATLASMDHEADIADQLEGIDPEIPLDFPVLPQVTDTDDIPF